MIDTITVGTRQRILRKMHNVAISDGDEDKYEVWITYGIPDGADNDDFLDIALDDSAYQEVVDLFGKLYK